MSDQSPLIVPLCVEALVVNDHTRAPRDGIVTSMRTQMDYRALREPGNAQASIDGNDVNYLGSGTVPPNNVPASRFYNGVYLKWRLPQALTRGTQAQGSQQVQYPPVPNRWMVVRYSGPLTSRQATAWIIESDYLYPPESPPAPSNISQSASAYTQPDSPTGMVYIGRNLPLGSWTESGQSLGLTSMGPGNPAFAVYQPQCNNVFSFCDCLDGQPDASLSYLVLGWFSKSGDDPLAPGMATVSLNNWAGVVSTVVFSAASAVEVAWTSGAVTVDGASYSIAAGTTGAMAATTYVYFSPSASATQLQLTTTLAVAQAPGCTLLATIAPFFVAQKAALGWTLPAQTDPSWSASWSLLCGSVNAVEWQVESLPPGGTPDGTKVPVSVAVGNTSVEALTALIAAQSLAAGVQVETELLEAFQLNSLHLLDEPDGAAKLAERVLASFFARYSGGYTWEIVDAAHATGEITEADRAQEAAWLATLNAAQASLDAFELQLTSLQRQLFVLWWKSLNWIQAYDGSVATECACLDAQDGSQPSYFASQLDPTISGSLAQQVAQAITQRDQLAKQVPTGATPEQLQKAIDGYAAQQGLSAGRQLKRGAAPLFFMPNNPVVLLAGAGASGIVESPDTIQCRFPSQVVTAFNFKGTAINASTPKLTIPQPPVPTGTGAPWTPSLIATLVNEFFLTDGNNAAAVAAAIGADEAGVSQAMGQQTNYNNTYPVGAVSTWTENPWHPLLLFWSASYFPIAYGTPDSPNWIFEGGQYTWNLNPAAVGQSLTLGGLIQLAPTAAFNMEARIKQFLDNNPDLNPQEIAALQALLDFVQKEGAWDLMSQALDGFNEQLCLGMPGVFLSPESVTGNSTPSLATLIGGHTEYPPNVGNIPMQGAAVTTSFQSMRGGQFEFTNLYLVDEWGQTLWPFNQNTYTKEIVFLPPDLMPVRSSNPVTVTVTSTPTIATVAPAMAEPGADLALTVAGVNFTSASTVQWNGTSVNTTFVSASQLTARVPANAVVAGTAKVAVQTAGSASNSLPVTVTSGPAIARLKPALLQAGMAPSATLTLSVRGVGFKDGALVQWNGSPLDTEVVSSTELIGQVPAESLFAPGEAAVTVQQGSAVSNSLVFRIPAGAMIHAISPSVLAQNGGDATLTVTGTGFEGASTMNWMLPSGSSISLSTVIVSSSELTASVPASLLDTAGSFQLQESVGAKVLPGQPDPLIQLPPALLQPARLDFRPIPALEGVTQLLPPGGDSVAGWVLPNHLDQSIMAYDAEGDLLGEMSVGIDVAGQQEIFWTAAPDSPYLDLSQVAAAIPHFGPALLALSQQTPANFTAFLQAIDETLWTTVPMGAALDSSLAVLMGRPLAFVRARLQFLLDGTPRLDPSWQFTFNPAQCSQLAPQTPSITGYMFGIKLGDIAQLEDGLIGYFVGDDYTAFNVVEQSGSAGNSFLRPIGVDNNFLYLPFDGKTFTLVSMLVDPRAAVHASTAILPTVQLSLRPEFVDSALANLDITFRVNATLTDAQPGATAESTATVLMATPKTRRGAWSWVEADEDGWKTYPTGPVDTQARLASTPTLRRGLLQLSSAVKPSPAREQKRPPQTHRKKRTNP